MKIVIGCDPAGVELKNFLMQNLSDIEFTDMGCNKDAEGNLTDPAQRNYPVVAEAVCREYQTGAYTYGILICGTGIGMAITANKVQGIRAAVIDNHYQAHMTREHNDANMLCLGARVTAPEMALELTKIFLETPVSTEPRHLARVQMITDLEARERA